MTHKSLGKRAGQWRTTLVLPLLCQHRLTHKMSLMFPDIIKNNSALDTRGSAIHSAHDKAREGANYKQIFCSFLQLAMLSIKYGESGSRGKCAQWSKMSGFHQIFDADLFDHCVKHPLKFVNTFWTLCYFRPLCKYSRHLKSGFKSSVDE